MPENLRKPILSRPALSLAELTLDAIPNPLVIVAANDQILHVNPAGEQFFGVSTAMLRGKMIGQIIPFGSPILSAIEQARASLSPVSEYGVELGSPRIGFHSVDVQASPLMDETGSVLLLLRQRSIAKMMNDQWAKRSVWRSVTGMAAVLAHEVKNPLSGIRGAAQLLESEVSENSRPLAQLIRDEADRICAMVDRMEVFSEKPLERGPVNIHLVLEHVRQLAQTGFANDVRFIERYDPSLPAVYGNRDQLVQVLLNLVKNASEARDLDRVCEITLTTAYRHGVHLALPGVRQRVELPLEVTVVDNGRGIGEEIRDNMFDPFISGKPGGSGLGLALVAKIVGDHGGTIDVDSQPGRTEFKLRLPVAPVERTRLP